MLQIDFMRILALNMVNKIVSCKNIFVL